MQLSLVLFRFGDLTIGDKHNVKAKARLDEDKKRIQGEQDEIDRECTVIDAELEEAVKHRNELEKDRQPLIDKVPGDLMKRYTRIRKNLRSGSVLAPLKGEACGGCHMHIMAQVVNEVMNPESTKIHGCQHCGRLLFHPPNFEPQGEAIEAHEA